MIEVVEMEFYFLNILCGCVTLDFFFFFKWSEICWTGILAATSLSSLFKLNRLTQNLFVNDKNNTFSQLSTFFFLQILLNIWLRFLNSCFQNKTFKINIFPKHPFLNSWPKLIIAFFLSILLAYVLMLNYSIFCTHSIGICSDAKLHKGVFLSLWSLDG